MVIDNATRREVAARLRNNLVAMRVREDWYRKDSNAVECGNAAYRNIAGSVEKLGDMIDGNYIHIIELLADLVDRPIGDVPDKGLPGSIGDWAAEQGAIENG